MKTTKLRFLFLLAIGSVVFLLVQAGDLEPPGPPAPTMVTLQEISDKLDACCAGGGPCGVPKTGQTFCLDEVGTAILCTGTGQDGEYQAGVSVDPRFTINGDGTVTDNLTQLIWVQNTDCLGFSSWGVALTDAYTLASGSCGLIDGSMAGDWRLPNVKELQSLIDFGLSLPALPVFHPFSGNMLSDGDLWSSTTLVEFPNHAWVVDPDTGTTTPNPKEDGGHHYVWPVRGGL